jgi:hypothetical protein
VLPVNWNHVEELAAELRKIAGVGSKPHLLIQRKALREHVIGLAPLGFETPAALADAMQSELALGCMRFPDPYQEALRALMGLGKYETWKALDRKNSVIVLLGLSDSYERFRKSENEARLCRALARAILDHPIDEVMSLVA